MGKLMTKGRWILKDLIAEKGEDGLLDDFVGRVIDGENTAQIAASYKIVVSVLWEWIHAEPERNKAYRGALKACADRLMHESLRDIEEATVETVDLAKLRSSHRLKMAQKWDKENYGEGGAPSGYGTGITVIVDRSCGGKVAIEAADGSRAVISE